MDLTMAIAIFSVVLAMLSFFFARKDKGESEKGNEQYNIGRTDEKLENISAQIDKLDAKIDAFDSGIETRIEKAISRHEMAYHHKGE